MSGSRIVVSASRRNVTRLRNSLVSEIDGVPQRIQVVMLIRLHRLGVDVPQSRDAVLLEEIGREDDAGDAGLDFKGPEEEAFGCAWALEGNPAHCKADGLIAVAVFQLLC